RIEEKMTATYGGSGVCARALCGSVIPRPRTLDPADVRVGPLAQDVHRVGQAVPERREPVLDGDGHGRLGVAAHESVALEATQGLRQHLLRDALDSTAQLGEAEHV